MHYLVLTYLKGKAAGQFYPATLSCVLCPLDNLNTMYFLTLNQEEVKRMLQL